MSPELQKQIFERLDVMAAKLGVAAQYLWGTLVRQSYVEGFTYLFVYLLWGCTAWQFFRELRGSSEGKVFVLGIPTFIGFIFFCCTFLNVTTDLFNPGFAALGHLKAVFSN